MFIAVVFNMSVLNLTLSYRAYWMSFLETESPTWRWLFQVDRKKGLYSALKSFSTVIGIGLYIGGFCQGFVQEHQGIADQYYW